MICSRGTGLLDHDIINDKDKNTMLKRIGTFRTWHWWKQRLWYFAQEDAQTRTWISCSRGLWHLWHDFDLDKDEDKDMHILLKRMVKFWSQRVFLLSVMLFWSRGILKKSKTKENDETVWLRDASLSFGNRSFPGKKWKMRLEITLCF